MLTQEQLDKLEKDITTAVDEHLAADGKLTSGGFYGNEDNTLCPIACLTGKYVGGRYDLVVAEKLHIPFTESDMWTFVRGFDNPRYPVDGDENNKLFLLGRKIRHKYLPHIDDFIGPPMKSFDDGV
jgi:hypothetical protein